uniref:Uncharacterized protein n=1 Tax=Solanum tuberosum TaxID=4113 RepID=M1B9V7_SOLTU
MRKTKPIRKQWSKRKNPSGLQLTKCKTKYTEVEIAILSQTILATSNCYYAFGNWKQPSILFWLGKGPWLNSATRQYVLDIFF